MRSSKLGKLAAYQRHREPLSELTELRIDIESIRALDAAILNILSGVGEPAPAIACHQKCIEAIRAKDNDEWFRNWRLLLNAVGTYSLCEQLTDIFHDWWVGRLPPTEAERAVLIRPLNKKIFAEMSGDELNAMADADDFTPYFNALRTTQAYPWIDEYVDAQLKKHGYT